jgi:ribonuclease P protein component
VRAALPLLQSPVDVILHPRRSVMTLEFGLLKREVAQIFKSVQAGCARAEAAKAAAGSEVAPTV